MNIPPLKVCFSDDDRREIAARIDACLASGQVAQGQNVDEFENSFARYNRSKFALAVSSGGSAIEASMWALDVRGKDVLVPTNTFLATAAGVVLAGGTAKLVDVDPRTLAPSVDILEAAADRNTAGVIVVHIGGIVTPEIRRIRQWCDSTGRWLFEDCAHAHGSEYDGQRAGSFGVAAAFSFFATKVITSGEGGMVVTGDEQVARRVMLMRNYGKPDPWITYSVEFGANWRLNEFAAAVGVVQLKRLDEFIAWRERIAALYTTELKSIPLLTPILPAGRSSWYKYIVLLPPGVERNAFKARAKLRGVSLSGGVYDLPLHRQPVFETRFANGAFPGADDFCARHICLPLYYGMTGAEARYVIETLRSLAEGDL